MNVIYYVVITIIREVLLSVEEWNGIWILVSWGINGGEEKVIISVNFF